MEAEIVAGVMDIARQPPEPAFAEAGPQQRADGSHKQAGDDEEFYELGHGDSVQYVK